jgi:hypothetical protein
MFTLEGREMAGLSNNMIRDLPSQSDEILQGFENLQKLGKTSLKFCPKKKIAKNFSIQDIFKLISTKPGRAIK